MSEKEKKVDSKKSHEKKPHHGKSVTSKIRDNPWIISTVVLGILVLIMLFSSFPGNTGSVVSEDKAAENLLGFLNAQTGGGVAYISSEDEGDSLYKVTVSYNGQNIPVYVTKDGNYYVQAVAELGSVDSVNNEDVSAQEIPKSERPSVELFVMSHCPYGTQAEKGILPAIKLLGDKIDADVRFVYYAMHPSQGEVEEQLNQYCIQEEQPEVYWDYLECFLEDGDGQRCLSESGVEVAKMNTCVAKADKEFSVSASKADQSSWLSGRYPLFNVHKDLNEMYSVGGSPTLVINGQQVNSGRSPAAMLDTICQSFTDGNVPEECSTSLPESSYAPGFGWTLSTGQATEGAQCY